MIYWKNYISCFCVICFGFGLFASCKKESVFTTEKPTQLLTQGEHRFLSPIIQFSVDTIYTIGSTITIDSGKTLRIDAGTLIRVNAALPAIAIIFNPGSIIEATGTKENPIVFTINAFKGAGGSYSTFPPFVWNGLRILGNGNSNSGALKYVRIEFGELLLQNQSELTKLENIQVSYSTGPSFSFNGGSCKASNLVSYASSSSDFHLSKGFKGKLQNLLAYRHPFFPPSVLPVLAGIQIEDAGTEPFISNATVLGPDAQPGITAIYKDSTGNAFRAALVVRNDSRFHIRNSVFMGFPVGGFYLDSKKSALDLSTADSEIEYSIFHSNTSSRVFYLPPNLFPGIGSDNLKNYLLLDRFHNKVNTNSSPFMFSDPYNYDINPDPLPKTGSPLLDGANFDGPFFNDVFFNKVKYIGALGTDNWLKDWTNFLPLQTDYHK